MAKCWKEQVIDVMVTTGGFLSLSLSRPAEERLNESARGSLGKGNFWEIQIL